MYTNKNNIAPLFIIIFFYFVRKNSKLPTSLEEMRPATYYLVCCCCCCCCWDEATGVGKRAIPQRRLTPRSSKRPIHSCVCI